MAYLFMGGNDMKDYVNVNIAHYFKVNDSMLDGVNLFKTDEVLVLFEQASPTQITSEAAEALMNRPRNTFKYIKLLRSLVFRLAQIKLWDEILINKLLSELNRVSDGYAERGRKRWTTEEDELLIEMAARDGINIIDLATAFGRTTGAITTRISYLVGVNRINTRVAGRFIGWLNGEQVEGDIDGTLSKTTTA